MASLIYERGMTIPSLQAFYQLDLPDQLGTMLMKGTFLATRVGPNGHRVNLYSLGHYFVELYYNPATNHLYQCRTFGGGEPLAAYAEVITLPEGF